MNIDLKNQLVGMQKMQQASREATVLDVQHLLLQIAQSYSQIPENVHVVVEVATGVYNVYNVP